MLKIKNSFGKEIKKEKVDESLYKYDCNNPNFSFDYDESNFKEINISINKNEIPNHFEKSGVSFLIINIVIEDTLETLKEINQTFIDNLMNFLKNQTSIKEILFKFKFLENYIFLKIDIFLPFIEKIFRNTIFLPLTLRNIYFHLSRIFVEINHLFLWEKPDSTKKINIDNYFESLFNLFTSNDNYPPKININFFYSDSISNKTFYIDEEWPEFDEFDEFYKSKLIHKIFTC